MKRPQSLDNSLNDVKYEQYINNLHDRLPSLVEPDDIDKNRWPWELVQNAKDTVVHRPLDKRNVDVKFRYFIGEDGQKKIQFEHNGDQFTDKAITGLIWKFSAEKRNETTEDGLSRDKQSTGRFGTGFMTTHALSLTVDVSGSMYNGDKGVERNVSVDFTLHREGPTDQDYRDGVDRTEKEMKFGEKEILQEEELPTCFTYHLRNEINEQAAETGLNNVRLNSAQTMLFCPTIRSITIDDLINNNKFRILRQGSKYLNDDVKETMFVEESNEKGPICRRFISIEVDEPSAELSNYWKVDNRHLRLHVAVEVDKDDCILPIPVTSPSVYCSLPLIGFEKMSLPFYINSNDFEPKTERTSLFLNQRRTKIDFNPDTNQEFEVIIQNGVNWSILERSISLYEKIVNYLIENNYFHRFNLVSGLNKILNASWTEEEKNCLASRFVLPLRKMLIDKNLIKTAEGYRSILSNVKIIECSKDKEREEFYDICTSVYGTEITSKEENQDWVDSKWSIFSFPSDFSEKLSADDNPSFPTIKYGDVADFVESSKSLDKLELVKGTDQLSWLNKLYRWVSIAKLSILSEKAIVPNRLGVFCKCSQGDDLKDASDIPSGVFDFMKELQLDWDEKLLMNGVENVILPKETTDNIVLAIKKRTDEIIDTGNHNVLDQLIPLLLAIPNDEGGSAARFLEKRKQIVSILSEMYYEKVEGKKSAVLDLAADSWKSADGWFMKYVAQTIADRGKLDIILDGEQNNRNNYCTAEWLSNTVKFMFENNYLHQENITSNEKGEYLSILPNRHGIFKPLNELYKQGTIPNQLLDDVLCMTEFDIRDSLLYENFILSDKVSIPDYSVSAVATKYNNFFNNDGNDNNKEIVASYLIHLVPESGDQYKHTRELYDIYKHGDNGEAEVIPISELSVWKGANSFLINFLAEKASDDGAVELIGKHLTQASDVNTTMEGCNSIYCEKGLVWLNQLSRVIRNSKAEIDKSLKLIPDWYGALHSKFDMSYDGNKLLEFKQSELLIAIIDGDLWNYYQPDQDEDPKENDEGIIKKIVHPEYCFVEEFQNNTNAVVFGLVDRMIENCSNHVSAEWMPTLKLSIKSLLSFFDNNERKSLWGYEDSKLGDFFKRTYHRRKEFAYDYIFDKETKERISEINESFSVEEINELIKERDLVKDILSNKEHYENLEEENEQLRSENDELKRQLKRYFEDTVDDKEFADLEEGEMGERVVLDDLYKKYPEEDGYNVIWASHVENEARYDFRIEKDNSVICYCDAKTTSRGLGNSDSIPFFMRKSQWLFLSELGDTPYYIARVFVADNNRIKYLRIRLKE